MSTVVNVVTRTVAVGKKGLLWLGGALLVFVGLVGPVIPVAQAVLWYVTGGGPPLDFDAPRDGRVIAHIDVLGRIPPDIARIRITNIADNAIVWDVKPLSNRSECWNKCWAPTFTLVQGAVYLFEVWDGKGRSASERFRL